MAPLLTEIASADLRPASAARRTALLLSQTRRRKQCPPLPGCARIGEQKSLFHVKQAAAVRGSGRRRRRDDGGSGRLACPPAPAFASGCGWWWPTSAPPSCAAA